MINFRFHIASLIAVFLALALGVVMGSTVIDRAIVEGLHDRIDRVESAPGSSGRGTRAAGRDDRLNAYVEQSAPLAVTTSSPSSPSRSSPSGGSTRRRWRRS